MSDLVTWLRAQLDEDERVVRQLLAEPGGFYIEAETPDVNVMSIGAYTARWEPKRMLAEVEAKRRILDDYADADHLQRVGWENDEPSKFEYAAREEALEKVVKLLAQPYAGRPGWREEWGARHPDDHA